MGLNMFDAKTAVTHAEQKLDRIIQLLELLVVATLHDQGIPPEEIPDLVAGKATMNP